LSHALRPGDCLFYSLDFVKDPPDQLILDILSDVLLLASHASCLEAISGVPECEGEEILWGVTLIIRNHGAYDIGKFWFGWLTVAST